MDAAIAGLFCNGVYTAFSMGVGGGHLMTIYIKETGEVTTLTAREMAPGYVTQDMFDDNPMGAQEGEETKRRRQSRTALKNFPFLFRVRSLGHGNSWRDQGLLGSQAKVREPQHHVGEPDSAHDRHVQEWYHRFILHVGGSHVQIRRDQERCGIEVLKREEKKVTDRQPFVFFSFQRNFHRSLDW